MDTSYVLLVTSSIQNVLFKSEETTSSITVHGEEVKIINIDTVYSSLMNGDLTHLPIILSNHFIVNNYFDKKWKIFRQRCIDYIDNNRFHFISYLNNASKAIYANKEITSIFEMYRMYSFVNNYIQQLRSCEKSIYIDFSIYDMFLKNASLESKDKHYHLIEEKLYMFHNYQDIPNHIVKTDEVSKIYGELIETGILNRLSSTKSDQEAETLRKLNAANQKISEQEKEIANLYDLLGKDKANDIKLLSDAEKKIRDEYAAKEKELNAKIVSLNKLIWSNQEVIKKDYNEKIDSLTSEYNTQVLQLKEKQARELKSLLRENADLQKQNEDTISYMNELHAKEMELYRLDTEKRLNDIIATVKQQIKQTEAKGANKNATLTQLQSLLNDQNLQILAMQNTINDKDSLLDMLRKTTQSDKTRILALENEMNLYKNNIESMLSAIKELWLDDVTKGTLDNYNHVSSITSDEFLSFLHDHEKEVETHEE